MRTETILARKRLIASHIIHTVGCLSRLSVWNSSLFPVFVGRCLTIYVSHSYRELFPLCVLGYAVDFPANHRINLLLLVCLHFVDSLCIRCDLLHDSKQCQHAAQNNGNEFNNLINVCVANLVSIQLKCGHIERAKDCDVCWSKHNVAERLSAKDHLIREKVCVSGGIVIKSCTLFLSFKNKTIEVHPTLEHEERTNMQRNSAAAEHFFSAKMCRLCCWLMF